MRERLVLPGFLLIVGLLGVGGCPSPETGVIKELPEPALHTKRRPRQVAPPPVAHRPPVRKAPKGPAGWVPKRGVSPRWKVIVVHHSATPSGDARHFDAAHKAKGWDELGYHFVIGNGTDTRDGAIEVGSRWTKQKHGAHCKVPGNYYNEHGIGICLVGDFNKRWPSRKQMASLTRLVGFLCRHGNIPLSKVTTHGTVTGKTDCPGRHFSLSRLKGAVAPTLATAGRAK